MSNPPIINWQTGDPPECGSYLVTDGEELKIDTWWEYSDHGNGDIRWLFSSDIGHPERFPNLRIFRRWGRFENVKWWAATKIPGI
jgi:hypothetical protein